MGPFSNDIELCLREFLKPLTNQVYTWYLNLKPGSIQHWEHMVSTFNTKSFYVEAKYILAELRPTKQYPGEGLGLYVKRFR